MLQEVLDFIHNYFVPLQAKQETYIISDDMISPGFGAEDGDRFLICGSRRNDGVYTWHADGIKNDDDTEAAGLRDETFAGTIRVMSVPPALITLSGEISEWVETYSGQLNSPMQSESFGGYSYTLKSGGGTGGSGRLTEHGQLTWRDIFREQLERYRRPFV